MNDIVRRCRFAHILIGITVILSVIPTCLQAQTPPLTYVSMGALLTSIVFLIWGCVCIYTDKVIPSKKLTNLQLTQRGLQIWFVAGLFDLTGVVCSSMPQNIFCLFFAIAAFIFVGIDYQQIKSIKRTVAKVIKEKS